MREPIEWEQIEHHNAYGDERHEAIIVRWREINRVVKEATGHIHQGNSDDDNIVVQALLAAGAPDWVRGASGFCDEKYWGLIGPEIPED
jgi:hypothetical protein